MFDSWLVIASGRNMIEEVRKRHDKLSTTLGIQEVRLLHGRWCTGESREPELSLTGAAIALQALRSRYIRDRQVMTDEYHVRVVKEKMSGRTLQAMLPDVIEEVSIAVKDHIATQGSGMRILFALGCGR